MTIALSSLAGGRIGIASQSLGIAQGSLDVSLKYTKQRYQFGKAISEFGAIKHFLADAPTHIASGGSILMIYSSHSGLSDVDFNGYQYELLEEIGLFFEKIYCVRLSPSSYRYRSQR